MAMRARERSARRLRGAPPSWVALSDDTPEGVDESVDEPTDHSRRRLLRNLGAHKVVLELLQIPYEKVRLIRLK